MITFHSPAVCRQNSSLPGFFQKRANLGRLGRTALILLGGCLGALGSARGNDSGAPAVVLKDLPLLFADDSGVASREGLVRTVHAAKTHPQPVIEPDQPWEGDRVYIYGSVYRDPATGGFRMWYMGRPGEETAGRSDSSAGPVPSLRTKGFDLTMLATSDDGLHWTKPVLGLHAFNGSAANNIIFGFHSPSVLWDRAETDPEKRYKMLGYLVRPYHAYHAAYSADGIHWKSYPQSEVLEHGDTITLSHDPRTGEYLAYHKRPAEVRGRGRRVVWLSRSKDFQHWSEPELVFVPDESDDAWVSRDGERTEVYDMSVYPHAAGFIGLPAIFRVMKTTPREQTGPGQSPLDGPIDIQLATSPDGRTWHRTWPRLAVIPRGAPGTFDGGAILGVASVPVDTDTETWVYYTAINTGHGGAKPPKHITIGRADWRLHGFVSLDAGPAGGRVETVPVQVMGSGLLVNADASRGELRIALREADGSTIPGCDFADGKTLRQNATAWRAEWKGGKVPTDRPVRVAMEMTNVRLYSLTAARK